MAYYREPISSASIAQAISTNHSAVDEDVAREMRTEYLKILDSKYLSTFKQKRDELYNQIVKPVYRSLYLKQEVSEYTFKVVDKKHSILKTIDVINKIICVGRIRENDVYLTEDTNISRVQGYIFTAGDKMLFLDIWSVCGTSTTQRSDKNQPCLSTLPRSRNILMFDKKEIVHLRIAEKIDILIIPKNSDQKTLESFAIYKDIQNLKLKQEQSVKDNNDNMDEEKQHDVEHILSDNEEQPIQKKKLSAKQRKFKDLLCDELDLSEYYDILIKQGIDHIAVLKELAMDDDSLQKVGIDKIGSRLKIKLYFQKSNNDNTANNNDQQDIEGVDIDIDQDCTAMIGK